MSLSWWPDQAERAQKCEPFGQETETITDGGEDGVGDVALRAGEMVAGHAVLAFEVADDGLNGGAGV